MAFSNRAVPVMLPPNFQGKGHSNYPATCPGCQVKGVWGWNARDNKPMIMELHSHGYASMHHCKTPQMDDIFPGWCGKCQAPDLVWLRKQRGFELSETYGLPHVCSTLPVAYNGKIRPPLEEEIQEMSKAKCRFCGRKDLLWVQVNAKFSIVDYHGDKHDCGGYGQMTIAWKEAKRMNYAFEKAWLKSIPDGDVCKSCKGRKSVRFFTKNKRLLAKYNTTTLEMTRPCLRCKRIGIFSPENKKSYLKTLRMRYWPFRGGVHKWKKYDSNGI